MPDRGENHARAVSDTMLLMTHLTDQYYSALVDDVATTDCF